MTIYAVIPLTCWLCALLAIPRRPMPDHEEQELAYRRLVARHQIMLALAAVTTLVFVLVLVLRATTAALAETPS